MTFLRNVWYAAAWSGQVEPGAMLARTILNEGILMFRDEAGKAVALRDRCPHRFAPLHLGKLENGVVACGYHGLQFDGRGACVLNPHGEGHIPPSAKVQNYPLEERYGVLWIWMGDAEQADAALIPDVSSVMNADSTTVRHYLNPKADYELMIDNLLDLGHTAFLHPDSLGSDAIVHSTRSTNIVGDTVVDELWAPDGEAPPLAKFLFPHFRDIRIDHWLTSVWHAPSIIVGVAGHAPAGANREGAEVMPGFHLLTPETDDSCHYFAALSRTFRRDEPQLDALIDMAVSKAFTQEDMPMVAAIQGKMSAADARLEDLQPVVLATDTAGLMARRVLRRKMKDEAAGSGMTIPPFKSSAKANVRLEPQPA